ncbi:MAG: glycosyltransferase family 2 protein [Chloroflexi bacterium]|nr:glycosyltransferase family 2 protein [Chloroflexota bacterium]
MSFLSVVLPAYNEEANVAATASEAAAVLTRLGLDYEIVVVDDGSHDATAAVVRRLAAENPRVRLVQHATNRGYGAALASGFAAARGDLVFLTDADKQFDIAEIERLLPHLAHADIVAGYRAPRRDPPLRVLFGRAWNALVNAVFGYTARDVDCAFKLFRRRVLDDVKVASRGAMFSAELLIRARQAGYRTHEVAVSHLPRRAGRPTGAKPAVILRAFRELLRFRCQLWRECARARAEARARRGVQL